MCVFTRCILHRSQQDLLTKLAESEEADSYKDLFDGYAARGGSDSNRGSTSIGREVSLQLIATDLPRTFPQLRLFDQEGPYYKYAH
jgi:hypothetical protein